MNQTARHRVDEVLPHVPTRQWVLTFPAPLRYLLAYDTELCTKTLGLFVDKIIAHYRFVLAREHGVDAGALFGGCVTSIQRAGSALQATLHFHTIALDGVYRVSDNEPPRILAAPRPSPAEIQAVAWATCQAVTVMPQRRGVALCGAGDDALDALAHEHPLLARCLAASQQGAVGLGDDAGRRLQRGGYGPTDGRGGAERDSTTPTPGYGFNLHAGLRVPANDRKRLERLCRYILSPRVSSSLASLQQQRYRCAASRSRSHERLWARTSPKRHKLTCARQSLLRDGLQGINPRPTETGAMNQLPKRGYLGITLAVVVMAACTKAPELPGSPKLTELARKTVDNQGGELDLSAGSKLEVPPGAIEHEVEIVIASADEAPAPLQEGTSAASEILVLQPHGQAFAEPLTLTIAFDRDPALPPQRYQVVRLSDENDETWELVENAFPNEDGTAVFTIETFSVIAVARRESDCRRARCSDNPSYYSSRYHACSSNGRAADYCNGWVGCAGPLSVDGEIVDLGGELCENLCSDNPCQNGTCTARGDGVTCTCFGGYEGRLCDQQVDLCPGDVDKVAPGACGCGSPDTDSDADGAFDCTDGCPHDANKVGAGICGCGVVDIDSDGDGTFDCVDDCPADANKIVGGVCGCGVADIDSDGDGAFDCSDACPQDPNKTFSGACGCGVADTDTDSDGTVDCQDECPTDGGKITAGTCGCGVADSDSDSDGMLDCLDGCPNDGNKTEPGLCGCGVAEGCNLPPVANPDSAVTKSSDPAIIDVLANDTDPNGDTLSLVSVGAASPSGTTLLGPTDRATYTPAAGFEGTATFDYVVSDGNGATATGTVTVTVVPDVSADSDQDGIDDSSELVFGYDPNDADSDDDGIGDAAEDINMNGVVDEDETSAIDPDTDDNGLCDGARADNDGDGVANPVDPCVGQQVIYVNPAAPAGGDGTSWATALNSPVDIVGTAAGQEAWVAAATYRPGAANTAVLVLTDGLSVFGGFQGGAGSGETSRAQRLPYVNLTILDGDLTGDGPTSDDACHVVIGANDVRLSGVVVQHGNATCGSASGGDYGAGMINLALGNVTVDRVTFIDNQGLAGTVYNESAEVTFIDVAFIGNRAGTGGGMDNTIAYPTMVNVAFVANADGGDGWGGGYSDAWFTEAVFDRVNFSRNLSHSGGGICTHDSGAVLNEVTFNQNGGASTLEGGGLSSGGSNLTLTNATFTGNHADAAGGNGGAIHLVDSNADVSNISVVNNTSPVGGGIYASGNTVATVSSLAFWNNPGGDLSSSARVMTPANTCSQDAITGTTMAQLAADPFVMPNVSGEVYLDTSASDLSCFDLGDDATATTLGMDWSNQTTQQDGALDADSGDGVSVGNDVDAGRHYDPMAVTIPSFATDASTITWTASNATQCLLTNDADWSLRPVAPGASPLPHTQSTGTELFLICFGNAGEPAVAWAAVP